MPLGDLDDIVALLKTFPQLKSAVPPPVQLDFAKFLLANFKEDTLSESQFSEYCILFLRTRKPTDARGTSAKSADPSAERVTTAGTSFRTTHRLPEHWVKDLLIPFPREIQDYKPKNECWNGDFIFKNIAVGDHLRDEAKRILKLASSALEHRTVPPITKAVIVDFSIIQAHTTPDGFSAPNVLWLLPENMRGYTKWTLFINPMDSEDLYSGWDNRAVMMPLALWYKYISRKYNKKLFAPRGFVVLADFIGFWWTYADMIMGIASLDLARIQMGYFLLDRTLPTVCYLILLMFVDRPLQRAAELATRSATGTELYDACEEVDDKFPILIRNAKALDDEKHLDIPFGTAPETRETTWDVNDHSLANCARIKAKYHKDLQMKYGIWYYSGNTHGGSLTKDTNAPQVHAVEPDLSIAPVGACIPVTLQKSTGYTNEDVRMDYSSPKPMVYDPFRSEPRADGFHAASPSMASPYTPAPMRANVLRSASASGQSSGQNSQHGKTYPKSYPPSYSTFHPDLTDEPMPFRGELPLRDKKKGKDVCNMVYDSEEEREKTKIIQAVLRDLTPPAKSASKKRHLSFNANPDDSGDSPVITKTTQGPSSQSTQSRPARHTLRSDSDVQQAVPTADGLDKNEPNCIPATPLPDPSLTGEDDAKPQRVRSSRGVRFRNDTKDSPPAASTAEFLRQHSGDIAAQVVEILSSRSSQTPGPTHNHVDTSRLKKPKKGTHHRSFSATQRIRQQQQEYETQQHASQQHQMVRNDSFWHNANFDLPPPSQYSGMHGRGSQQNNSQHGGRGRTKRLPPGYHSAGGHGFYRWDE